MKGRGIDFKHRFNSSRWAEDLLISSLGDAFGVKTVRFGISTYVPEGEKLVYGNSNFKEPDLLLFRTAILSSEEKEVLRDGQLDWNERTQLGKAGLGDLLKKAFAALEIEFSPYRAKEMKERHWKIRSAEKWEARPLKHAKPPTAPNIWVKEEDIEKLGAWQDTFGIPIAVAHFFDQEAFAVALNKVSDFRREYLSEGVDQKKLQVTSGIFAKIQDYDRVDLQGAGEQKPVFVITPAAAEHVGNINDVTVSSQIDVSSSKKYVSHVIFTGGKIDINPAFIDFLTTLGRKR
ncbi:MAG TPA: hypothetical protein VH413_15600 [Verrucomicrobiae bacterium]|jgi:hypothetical protein|nr:hypothetical protein [Verrucomicrobiae bacterium]